MRHTFKTSEIAHIWAHDHEQPVERRVQYGKAGSMSFNNDLFYSYGTVIARKLFNAAGECAIVQSRYSYSQTTSGHQSVVRSATYHMTRFMVYPDRYGSGTLNYTPQALFDYYIARAGEHAEKAANTTKRQTRVRADAEQEQASCLEYAKQVSAFFGLGLEVNEDTLTQLKERQAADLARKEAERAERERLALLDEQDRLAEWLNGKGSYDYFPNSPCRLRLHPDDGSIVQTSRGAEIPVADAIRAYRFITSRRGQEWRRNGERFEVGNYQLDAVNHEGIVAGCHRIAWDEIERFAAVLGLVKDAAVAA